MRILQLGKWYPPRRGGMETVLAELSRGLSDRGHALRVRVAGDGLRGQVERDGEYVGKDFAKEARAIHDGEKPERQIYGEAKLEDAKKLVEDGIPVAPLPFTPKAKLS